MSDNTVWLFVIPRWIMAFHLINSRSRIPIVICPSIVSNIIFIWKTRIGIEKIILFSIITFSFKDHNDDMKITVFVQLK